MPKQTPLEQMEARHAGPVQECIDGLLSGVPPGGGSVTRADLDRIIRTAFCSGAVHEWMATVEGASKKPPVPALDGAIPVVTYFGNAEDADAFIQLLRLAHPGLKPRAL